MRDTVFHPCDTRFALALLTAILGGVTLLICPGLASAQAITPTTGSGNLGTTVTQNGNTYTITGGTRPGGGGNLFHSFGEFGVPTNNIANFLNETLLPTSNILGRVTGGNPSEIFGTIRTTDFGSANLFLMNPAGIVFGPNAKLDVRGLVNFTTANYIRLFDEVNSAMFYANPASDAVTTAGRTSILSSAPLVDFGFVTPAAFGFITDTPASITVQGSALSVPANQSISLVGGDVIIGSASGPTTHLSAPNGQINTAGAASPGEFAITTLEPLSNIDGMSFSSFGSIALRNNSAVNVSGANTVSIRGGAFTLSVDNAVLTTAATAGQANEIILSNGSVIAAETRGVDPSGDITLNAKTVELNDGSTLTTRSLGSGAAGDINVTVSESLTLQRATLSGNPSRILSDANSDGNSGTIDIQAPSGSVKLDGGLMRTSTLSNGLAGDINLNVRNLTALAGGQIATSGSDAAPSGSITVTASDTISFSGRVDPSDASSASGIFNENNSFSGTGSISVETGRLLMAEGSRIRNHAFFDLSGTETPKVSIVATDAVALSGGSGIIVETVFGDIGPLLISSHSISLSDVSVISTRTVGPAAAAPLNLNAHTLSLTGGSQVVSSTEQDAGRGGDVTIVATDRLIISGQGVDQNGSTISSGIFTFSSPFATGDAGHVSLSAGTIEISSNGQINSSTFGSGQGGTITATTSQSFLLNSGGAVSADSTGSGNSGSIGIQAGGDFRSSGGSVSTTAAQGTGGDILVAAGQDIRLTAQASLSANSSGPGNAGNITALAGDDFIMQNSSITTQATQASGGNIKIGAVDQIQIQNSLISASVQGGAGSGGNISIDPRAVFLMNSRILANAVDGNGGNISIITPFFLADQASVISASSQFGIDGTVTIQSPTSNLAGTVASLPSSMRQTQALQTGRCAALAHSQSSSFLIAGRDTIPAEPGGWLPSSFAYAGADTDPFAEALPPVPSLTAMAEETISLRRLTPAGFLTQRFAEDGSTGCRA